MQKGFAPILIILLVTVLGIGGYFVYTKYSSNQNKTPSQNEVDETANWKTYINITGSYSIKYPEDLLVIKDNDPTYVTLNFKNQTDDSKLISITINPGVDSSIRQAVENTIEEAYSGKYQGEAKFDRLMIDGVKALGHQTAMDYNINLIHNGNIFNISLEGNTKGENKAVFDKILSTFKFTEPNSDTSNWKTYNDPKNKFEFKYPEELTTYNTESGAVIFNKSGKEERPNKGELQLKEYKLSEYQVPAALAPEDGFYKFDTKNL